MRCYLQKVKIVESIQKLAYIFTFYYYTYNISLDLSLTSHYIWKMFFFISLWKKIPWFLWTLITDICNTDEGRTYHKYLENEKKICARCRYLLFLLISKRKKICKHPPLFFKYRPASKFVFLNLVALFEKISPWLVHVKMVWHV